MSSKHLRVKRCFRLRFYEQIFFSIAKLKLMCYNIFVIYWSLYNKYFKKGFFYEYLA